MANTEDDEITKQKSIDEAISDCRRNIWRHGFASFIELLAALAVLAAVSYTMLQLARMQGGENDQKRLSLLELDRRGMEAVRGAEPSVERARSRVEAASKSKDEKELPSAQQQLEAAQKRYNDIRDQAATVSKELDIYVGKPLLSETLLYGAAAILFLVVAIFSGIYRFHLKEISKNEKYNLAFMRIRIAGNNAMTPGFDGEVRTSLTKNAFDVPVEDQGLLRRRKIESPLEGHPTTDLATAVINRVFDEVDVIVQPKAKGKKKHDTE